MKERPILFSAAMVRKILAGEKTVTRRVMKPQPSPGFLARGVVSIVPQWPQQDGVRWFMADGMSELVPCPYGKPGDRLWCQETWWHYKSPQLELAAYDDGSTRCLIAPGRTHDEPPKEINDKPWHPRDYDIWRCRPSIHMPRWASRITLEITGVRAEKLQEISDKDARAEGMESCTPADQFRVLWDSLNGEREGCSWASDPFVWALSFRRLDV